MIEVPLYLPRLGAETPFWEMLPRCDYSLVSDSFDITSLDVVLEPDLLETVSNMRPLHVAAGVCGKRPI